jgi:hypothetical protein
VRRLAIAAALAAGCSGAEPTTRRPEVTPPPAPAPAAAAAPALPGPFHAVEPPGGPGPGATLPVVAARVFALGDTQLHHMYGKRGFAQSPFADRFARLEVAIRPAALDDGTDLLLEAFLAERRARAPAASLVYMGDAADLSCTQEYDRFFAVMAGAGESRFLMLTSNHDGFYVGNYTQKADLDGDLKYTDMPDDWTRACAEPDRTDDHRLTRGRAIERIAAVLPDAPAWATHHAVDDADDPKAYAKSYLAFARPLAGGDPGAPPAWGLFLDTADYRDHDVRKSRGAGTVGSVSRDQLRALDHAAFEADAADPQTAWIAFGHHPISDFDRGARERFLAFLDGHPRIVAYVSAHTHFSDERSHTLRSGRKLIELVVGATGDFGGTSTPEAAREIEIRIDPDTGATGVTSTRLELDVDALCGDIPARRASDPLGYTAYRINRDDTGDLPTGISMPIEALLHDLTPTREHQTAGALLVEGKLVRSLAALHADAPGGVAAEHAREVQALIDQPFLPPAAQAIPLTAWETWIDPALHKVPAMTHRVHRFARHRALFEALRATRTSTPERRRYFTCHAARAAEAEVRVPRTDATIRRIR